MDNLRLLRSFLIVLEEASMIDAAARLGCSPPAVSQQIARLEKMYGARLLDRTTHGVTTTEIGTVLRDHARELLGVAERLEEAVELAKDPTRGKLRITAFSSANAHLLPDAIAQFRKQYPGVRISLADSIPERQFDPLLAREADITLVPEFDHVPLLIPEGIDCQLIGIDPFRIVLAADSPLARKKVIRFQDLKHEEFISFSSRFPHVVTLRHGAAQAGFIPNITSEISDYDVIPALVAAGMGCSIATPLMLAGASMQNIAVRKLIGPAIKRQVYIATRSGAAPSFTGEMQQALRVVLKEVAAKI